VLLLEEDELVEGDCELDGAVEDCELDGDVDC
jgi:hypothetical protein